jgi:uncharacterized protein (DUF58 family)
MRLLPVSIRLPRFPIAIKFTREGLIFVLLSLAIGAAAVNTGNNILYLIFSLMLGFIVVSGMISRRMLLGLKPVIDFPDKLFAGVPSVCHVSVFNRKKTLPSLGIRFSIDQPAFAKTERYFFYIPAQESVHGFTSIRFLKRGVFSLREMELQTRFPFSFFTKIRRYTSDQQVRVYPALYRLSEEVLARAAEGLLLDSPYRGESHQLLHLRDYTSLDSSNRIHWKASAKMEKLLIKEYQREQGRDLRVYFDVYPVGQDEQAQQLFEKAISLIASLAFLFFDRGTSAVICFPDREFEITPVASSFTALLEYLTALHAGELPQSRYTPPTGDDLVLQVRSHRVPAVAATALPTERILFLEEWSHLMQTPVESAGGGLK